MIVLLYIHSNNIWYQKQYIYTVYILIAVDILMYGFISELLRWLCRCCSSWNASSTRSFSRKDWSFLCLARYFWTKITWICRVLLSDCLRTRLLFHISLVSPRHGRNRGLQIKDVNMCKLHDFILDFCVGLLENMSMCHEFQKIQVSIGESLRLGKNASMHCHILYLMYNISHMK